MSDTEARQLVIVGDAAASKPYLFGGDCGDQLHHYEPHAHGEVDSEQRFVGLDGEAEMGATHAEFSRRLEP